MSKKVVVLVLIALCVVSIASKVNNNKAVSTFKVEQIGVRM